MNRPIEGVTAVKYGRGDVKYVIVLVLDPDEAETVGWAFGPNDAGGEEIRRWAEEARESQREWDDGR